MISIEVDFILLSIDNINVIRIISIFKIQIVLNILRILFDVAHITLALMFSC